MLSDSIPRVMHPGAIGMGSVSCDSQTVPVAVSETGYTHWLNSNFEKTCDSIQYPNINYELIMMVTVI